MTDDASTILLVEDDDATRTFLADNLAADGFVVATASGAGEGVRQMEVRRPDLVLLDLMLDDGSGLALTAVRPDGVPGHEPEATWAALLGAAGSLRVDEPRLSTTYDEDGRQRRAGLELWVGEDDDYPRRAAGDVVCGSTLDLGQLRLDCAFFAWQVDGREGVGRYDVLRRA